VFSLFSLLLCAAVRQLPAAVCSLQSAVYPLLLVLLLLRLSLLMLL
jgi:hypothetical protein